MIQILLCGCYGKMGKFITELAAERDDLTIAAGVDQAEAKEAAKFPVFRAISEVNVPCDVVIDFSNHSQIPSLLDFVGKTKIPAVIGTTGLDENLVARIEAAARTTPILRSGNMSLGVNLLVDLVTRAAQVLHETFDIEIIEQHHNRKVDAPSGTALMLADAINQALEQTKTYVYGRYGKTTPRVSNEIGIHAVRGGTIVGEHSVIFAGSDEVVEIHHRAASRRIFAAGALNAAQFLVKQKPGLYTMKDVLKD